MMMIWFTTFTMISNYFLIKKGIGCTKIIKLLLSVDPLLKIVIKLLYFKVRRNMC